MAHLATKRFNYWSQLAILAGITGFGFIVGAFLSLIPVLGSLDLANLKSMSSSQVMENLFKQENASALRWMQFISTLFLFFLPPVFYAWICHTKPFMHLGFKRKVTLPSAGTVILIMFASLFLVGAMQELTEMLPWSKATLARFKEAEDSYNKVVAVIARMNNFQDYLITVLIVAFLPAVFEETLFRGALQNLLSRWLKMPVLAIVITAAFFSAVHGSYLGFLSRFALGFVLGWMYYRTGNIWLNILGHFFNNAFAITYLYISTHKGQNIDPSKIDDRFPLWVGLLSIFVVYGLFRLFENVNKNEITHPGAELPVPGVAYTNNPFYSDAAVPDKSQDFK